MGYMANLIVRDRRAVVVGGGAVAARKIAELLTAGAKVTIIAPSASDRIRSLAGRGLVAGQWRPYRAADLDGAFLAIAATDDEAVNRRIARDALARNVLVNVVDRPELCTFTAPATARRGDLAIAVTTSGLCPSLSGALREEILECYGPEYARLVRLFGKLRKQMIALGWDGSRIKRSLQAMYRAGIIKVLAARDPRRLQRFLKGRLGSEYPSRFSLR